MTIQYHPDRGSILMCDFSHGFSNPEMDKKRPVIVLSPNIRSRQNLCTVVALSTTPPETPRPYHCQINITPPLPAHYESNGLWVKGDMVNAVGFHRLDLIKVGKNKQGKRLYYLSHLNESTMKQVYTSVLHGMGFSNLTKHL